MSPSKIQPYLTKNATLFGLAAILLAALLFKPFAITWILLIGATFYFAWSPSKNHTSVLFFIFTLTLLIYTPYISTKSSWAVIGNDKPQYIDFMRSLTQSNFWQTIMDQPEIVSFFLIKLSAELAGPTDGAFAIIFLVSFALFIIGSYRAVPPASIAFIVLFLSSSVFFNIFGNTIRQGLALSLITFTLSAQGRKKFFYVAISALSHFSSLAVSPYLILRQALIKLKIQTIAAISLFSYASGAALPKLMASLTFSLAYLEKKRAYYLEYESLESGSARITFFATFILIVISRLDIVNRKIRENPAIPEKQNYAIDSLYSISIYLSFLLLFFMHISDFFARFYLYYLTFSIFYIAAYVYTRQKKPIRAIGAMLLIAYASISLSKNMSTFSLFYTGRSLEYIDDGFLKIIQSL